MAKINGTLLLVYVDGVVIAAQNGVTFNVTQELFDTSTKDDDGWTTHGNGRRSFDVTIDGLVSTTGISANELVDYITDRNDLLLVIEGGFTYPYVMQADMASVSLTGPSEEALTISGSITGTGPCYHMTANLVTTLGASDTYDTFTAVGISVTEAIDAAGGATADSDNIDVTDTYKYMVFTFLTNNGGLELPTIGLYSGAGYISNQPSMTAGANFITLTATATDATSTLRLENTAACNYELTDTYVWEIAV